MSKSLIILIHDYPYNNGEPFFETEINYLSDAFEFIYIFSTMGRKKEKQTRKYPKNVRCFPLGCSHNRIKYVIRGFVSRDNKFFVKDSSFKKRMMSYYVLGRNIDIFKKAIRILDDNALDVSETTIYSYWLSLGIAGIKLSDFIFKEKGYVPRAVSRCHGYDLYSEVMPYNYQPFQKQVINELDSICPCSDFGTKYLIKKYTNCSNKISTHRLGTEDRGVGKIPSENDEYVFVTCSGLRKIKRLTLFAKAFSKIAQSNHNIRWLCIGDGEEKKEILNILNKQKTIDSCIFMGNISNKAVYDLYRNKPIYCFVNVSSSEGIPVSIMEAISFGIPVIATNVGGNSEIVNSQNGFLLSANPSVAEISDAMKRIISLNNENYKKLRNASRNKWEELYSSKSNYSRWSSFLKDKKKRNN